MRLAKFIGFGLPAIIALSACNEAQAPYPGAFRTGADPAADGEYTLPERRDVSLTQYTPDSPTGLFMGTRMTFGQLQTYQVEIGLPSGFTFNGFDALAPIGERVGAYGFDFSSPPDGRPDRVMPIFSLSPTTAFADAQLDGVYVQDRDALVEFIAGAGGEDHTIRITIPFGGDGDGAQRTAGFDSDLMAHIDTGIFSNPSVAGDYLATARFVSVDPDSDGIGTDDGVGDPPLVLQDTLTLNIRNATLQASVLPNSRAVAFNGVASTFASLVNDAATTATGCTATPATVTTVDLLFQTTNPADNSLTGAADTAFDIAAGETQTLYLALTPRQEFFSGAVPFAPVEFEFAFDCDNADPAPVFPGVNTLSLSAFTDTPADLIAIGATVADDGVVYTDGVNSGSAFAAAAINVGVEDEITIRPRATLAVDGAGAFGVSDMTAGELRLLACETTGQAGGACLAPPQAELTTTFAASSVRTFTVFVRAQGVAIPFDAARNRVFLDFLGDDGIRRGSTSVAITTNGPPE